MGFPLDRSLPHLLRAGIRGARKDKRSLLSHVLRGSTDKINGTKKSFPLQKTSKFKIWPTEQISPSPRTGKWLQPDSNHTDCKYARNCSMKTVLKGPIKNDCINDFDPWKEISSFKDLWTSYWLYFFPLRLASPTMHNVLSESNGSGRFSVIQFRIATK